MPGFYKHEITHAGIDSSYANTGKLAFNATYRLYSDDSDYQADEALEYVLANIAAIGDTYAAAGESNSNARLVSIEPRPVDGSSDPWLWLTLLRYEAPADDEEQLDDNGLPTSNPVNFRATVDLLSTQRTKPAEKAEFLSGYNGDSLGDWPVGTVGPLMNSAMNVLNPPFEVDDSRRVIYVKRNFLSFTANEKYNNVVNDAACTIQTRGLLITLAQYQGKVRDFAIRMRRTNGVDHLEASAYIDVNPDTWRLSTPDMGVQVAARPGDPNGRGGTWSSADMKNGVPRLRPLLDHDDQPIREPVHFNGNGQLNTTDPLTVVDLKWKYYTEDDYTSLSLFNGIFT